MHTKSGLVSTTRTGSRLSAGHVRRMFKNVCQHAGIDTDWTPRELRTSFVSPMSERGVSTEEIARLVGHSSTRVTETVYRRELWPVITTGVAPRDAVFQYRKSASVEPELPPKLRPTAGPGMPPDVLG